MTAPHPGLIDVIADGSIDAELGALLWLLVEGGVPLTVTGPAAPAVRRRLGVALLSVPPATPWVLVDADEERPGLATLGARIRGGVRVGISLGALDLRDALERLSAPPDGLPEDAVRRLGIVLVVGEAPTTSVGVITDRSRVLAAHYLRPTERDSQGHVQRRPPAVLATLRPDGDDFDHFAWGSTPELASLVDRTQAGFEETQASRAHALRHLSGRPPVDPAAALLAILGAEAVRQPAVAPAPARPSPARDPLTDPHVH
jgi:hypothetical protein